MRESTGARSVSTVFADNTFYHTDPQQSTDGTVYPAAADAHMTDFTFVTDRFTLQPRTITVPGVISSSQSPHLCEIPTLPTCENQGWQCCSACAQTAHADFDDNCPIDQACCAACEGQESVCAQLDGSCCAAGQICAAGSMETAPDCPSNCCVGGRCEADWSDGDDRIENDYPQEESLGDSTPAISGGCQSVARSGAGLGGLLLLCLLAILRGRKLAPNTERP